MPRTPWRSTSSAILKAFTIEVLSLETVRSRSLGMTMRVSTFSFRTWMPFSACMARRRPSKVNGRVTTPMVRAPSALGHLGHHRRRPGAGAAALAGGDEDHVGPLQRLFDLGAVLLGGLAAHLGIAPGPEAPGQLAADVELEVGVAHQQRLGVGVGGDELDVAQPRIDHAVDGVDAAAADPDHLDDGEVVALRRNGHELPRYWGRSPADRDVASSRHRPATSRDPHSHHRFLQPLGRLKPSRRRRAHTIRVALVGVKQPNGHGTLTPSVAQITSCARHGHGPVTTGDAGTLTSMHVAGPQCRPGQQGRHVLVLRVQLGRRAEVDGHRRGQLEGHLAGGRRRPR